MLFHCSTQFTVVFIMAEAATASDHEQVPTVSIKVLVDKEKNKVLFAEARKDFADILLSFLSMPLGTIVRLVAKESNVQPVKVGSLSSLYESVSCLDEEYFLTQTCKEMLLQPRSSMESYCQQLKLNIDDTEPTKYFVCEDLYCVRNQSKSRLGIFKNQKCYCGKIMSLVLTPENMILEKGFVKETATFIVSDNLNITPNVFRESVDLFQKLGIKDMKNFEERTVDISKKEVVDLLKLSLISKTPMTDFILKKDQYVDMFIPINKNQNQIEMGEVASDEGRQMIVKVQIRKSNGKILFAEAEEGFVNFLFSFLTFPLGGVVHMLEGFSSLNSIDKLYRSMTELSSDRYFRSEGLKEKLTNPVCAAQFNLSNQILPIRAEHLPVYYCHSYYNSNRSYEKCNRSLVTSNKLSPYYNGVHVQLNIVNPKCPTGESSGGGFARGPETYMVTDELVVTPMSALSAVSYLNTLQVPLSDLEERVITIGVKEVLGILKASLTSTFALTNSLKHFLKPIKDENGPITSVKENGCLFITLPKNRG